MRPTIRRPATPASLPRPRDDASRPPVLIEVPRLRSRVSRAGGPHASAATRSARPGGSPPRPRPRRRLRREFRLAAAGLGLLLAGAGLTFGLLHWTSGHGPRRAPTFRVEASAPAFDPPSVFLSTELQPVIVPTAAGTEADMPLVQPSGYLLPDDAPEGLSHAGS